MGSSLTHERKYLHTLVFIICLSFEGYLRTLTLRKAVFVFCFFLKTKPLSHCGKTAIVNVIEFRCANILTQAKFTFAMNS